MTKAELAGKVREKFELPVKESMELVETVLEIMKRTLETGEDLKISGFGSFKVRNKADRQGRNPITGEQITVTRRRVVTFKPSLTFKDYINS